MKKLKNTNTEKLKLSAAFALVLLAASGLADALLDPNLIDTEGDPQIKTGRFYGYRTVSEGPGNDAFVKLRNKAINESLPLIVIWSAVDCKYCNAFTADVNSKADQVSQWMAGKTALFGFFKGSTDVQSAASRSAYDFCDEMGAESPYDAWPWYGIYYYDQKKGMTHVVGGSLTKRNSATTVLEADTAEGFMFIVDKFLAAYQDLDEVPVPGSADFYAGGQTADAQMQAMPSTETVYVPLVRTENLGICETNLFKAKFPDGDTFETNIVWEADKTAFRQVVDVPVSVGSRYAANSAVGLELRNSMKVLNATNSIRCVGEAENSIRFPLWRGERNENTLAWGEWTVDIDVATNKVARWARDNPSAKAYTLVAVGGALWCPNCTNMEKYVYSDPKFSAWARNRRVALVTLDQPNQNKTGPTLYTHDVGESGGGLGRSGSSYLSRKGLTTAQGAEQFNRVYALSHTRWPGGWLVEPTASRIANPVLIILRPDGTPAGRFSAQRVKTGGSTSNEPYDIDENIARLDELLALADDGSAHGLGEETNNKPGTTLLRYSYGVEAAFKLQVNDRADVFLLDADGYPAGKSVRFDLSTDGTPKSMPSIRALRPVEGVGSAMLCEEIGPIGSNTWCFTKAQLDAGVYLEVSAYADHRYNRYGGGSEMSGALSAVEVPPDPGAVGFTARRMSAVEGAGPVMLAVERRRGASGEARARVRLDAATTTSDADLFAWDDSDPSHMVVWGDAEFGEKEVALAIVDDGIWVEDRTIGFVLEILSDGVEQGEFTRMSVAVSDDDSKSRGKVAFTASSPVAVEGMIVEASPGSAVTFTVSRTGGSVGDISVLLKASSSSVTLSTNRLYWASGNGNLSGRSADQTVTVVLPASGGDLGGEGHVVVELQPADDESSVVAGRSRATIRMLGEDRAAFESDDAYEATATHVIINEIFRLIGELPQDTSNIRVEKVSGSLPEGVEAVWNPDVGGIEVSGAARCSAESEAKIRLAYETDGQTHVSHSVSVAFSVQGIDEQLAHPLVARTYNTLPVVDGLGCIVGMLNLAVPKSGRISAKYRREDGVDVVFSAKGWSYVSKGAAVAEIQSASGRHRLVVASNGAGSYDVTVVDGECGILAVDASRYEQWTASSPADAYAGVYTVDCSPCADIALDQLPPCSGDPVFCCRLSQSNAGRMLWAGRLPNGTSFSGSSRLIRDGGAISAALPVFFGSAADTFGAAFRIASGGKSSDDAPRLVVSDDAMPAYWHHRATSSGTERYSCLYDVFGSLFDDASDWRGYWQGEYGNVPMLFRVSGFEQSTKVTVTSGNAFAVADPSDNPLGLVISSFDAASGSLTGTVSPDGSTQCSFHCILLPGWTDCDCGGEDEVPVRPFAVGSCWWRARAGGGGAVTTFGTSVSIDR